jgi:Rho-binding antiterminator
MDSYIPVSCDFHDELEAIATLRQTCRIVYRTEADTITEVEARIADVYAANQADYVKLDNGTAIRLDRVVSVNDKPVSFCTD